MTWTWLQFFSSIIDSLAWPVAVVAIAFLLRRPLLRLIGAIRFLRYGDLEIEIDQDLDRIERQLPDQPPVPIPQPEDSREKDLFENLVAVSPKAAILATWQEVEHSMNELARNLNIATKSWMTVTNLTKLLESEHLIDYTTKTLLADLRTIRNKLAHSRPEEEVSENEARRYREFANVVLRQLQDRRHGGTQQL